MVIFAEQAVELKDREAKAIKMQKLEVQRKEVIHRNRQLIQEVGKAEEKWKLWAEKKVAAGQKAKWKALLVPTTKYRMDLDL